MSTDPRALTVLMIIATWGGVIAPALFAIQYTYLARWWRSPNGRAIMGLDACIFLARVPRIGEMIHDGLRPALIFGTFDWAIALASLGIPLVVMYRMVVFERQRRRQARRELQSARLAALGCQ